jgi:hypothetical protein
LILELFFIYRIDSSANANAITNAAKPTMLLIHMSTHIENAHHRNIYDKSGSFCTILFTILSCSVCSLRDSWFFPMVTGAGMVAFGIGVGSPVVGFGGAGVSKEKPAVVHASLFGAVDNGVSCLTA